MAPELVVYGAQQRPHAVRYHLLTPMLLDETQRQRRTLDALGELVEAQRTLIDRLEARVRDLETAASGDGEGNS